MNVLFKDIIQVESEFVTNSVFINGVKQLNVNPNQGFNIGEIEIGKLATIDFEVVVNSLPTNGQILNKATVQYDYYIDPVGAIVTNSKTSNETVVNINNAIVSANKSVDKENAQIDGLLTYTVTIQNKGNAIAEDVYFKDVLDSNLLFETGSVVINNVVYSNYNPNIGLDIPDINTN